MKRAVGLWGKALFRIQNIFDKRRSVPRHKPCGRKWGFPSGLHNYQRFRSNYPGRVGAPSKLKANRGKPSHSANRAGQAAPEAARIIEGSLNWYYFCSSTSSGFWHTPPGHAPQPPYPDVTNINRSNMIIIIPFFINFSSLFDLRPCLFGLDF